MRSSNNKQAYTTHRLSFLNTHIILSFYNNISFLSQTPFIRSIVSYYQQQTINENLNAFYFLVSRENTKILEPI